jgi:hypothetical protein
MQIFMKTPSSVLTLGRYQLASYNPLVWARHISIAKNYERSALLATPKESSIVTTNTATKPSFYFLSQFWLHMHFPLKIEEAIIPLKHAKYCYNAAEGKTLTT